MFDLKIDARQMLALGQALREGGNMLPDAVRRAVNHTGDKARTQVIRALTAQTGLKRSVIVRAIKVTRANYGSSDYVLKSRGGNISLKYFSPRETKAGVTAGARGKRKLYPGAFITGGRWGKRVELHMGGHVFQRKSDSRTPIKKVKSGVYIPIEMTTGDTAAAFYRTVEANLANRLAHEMSRALPD